MQQSPREQRPLSKGEAVWRSLRSAIIDGSLPAGARLRQDEIAARWEVSSTPVREAFRRLEAEGLVELLPHRGVVVAGPATPPGLVNASDLTPGSDFP
ncbi:MAG: GntR family transcriptional regulator [Dehalococcoidia bacterium]|nr:GntR family transcriptional regulator [Dehalococcoidia bacterium]